MKQYLDLLKTILKKGIKKNDRTKTGTKSIFGYQMRFNLSEGFPLLTTKKLHLKSIIYELLWFLKGDTNIYFLKKKKIFIWDHWADEKGDLGPIYGFQWRSWPDPNGKSIDQIDQVIKQIKNNPNSRRLIVSSWNVAMLPNMALPPCHLLFQFYVSNGNLSLQFYQRSADVFIGLPFNIASYALLLIIFSQITNLKAGELIATLGDAHIYNNHIKQIHLQMKRKPRLLPKIRINTKIKCLSNIHFKDFKLENYNPYDHIKGKVSI